MVRFLSCLILILGWLPVQEVVGQTSPLFIPPPGIPLDSGWKWQAGDNPEWAKTGFNDSKWARIDPSKDIRDIPQLWNSQIGWFRLHFRADSTMTAKSMALLIQQTGASEIYFNGRLIGKFGKLSDQVDQIRAVSSVTGTFLGMSVQKTGEQVLAIRFAIQKDLPYIEFVGQSNVGIKLLLIETNAINFFRAHDIRPALDYFKFGLFLLLAIVHLALFCFDTSKKANFYLFIYSVCSATYSLLLALVYYYVPDTGAKMAILLLVSLLYVVNSISFVTAVYDIFNYRRSILYWLLVVYGVVSLLLLRYVYHGSFGYGVGLVMMFSILESIRVTFLSARDKKRGASIIVWGASICLISNILWLLVLLNYLPSGPAWIYGHLASNIAFTSIPVSISIYLALDSSFTSSMLRIKLDEVETLSGEKQQMLSTQNEVLEAQVTERTAELEQKNRELVVEAALEKVRGRTMAMQKSIEVLDVASTLYEELQHLGFTYGACTIQIMVRTTGDMEHWVAGFAHLKYPKSYYVPYFNHPCYEAQLTAWRNGEKYLVYELAGDEKKLYDAVMFTKSEYQNFPETEKNWMQTAESVIFSLAYMKHGALHWGPSPLTEQQADILQRFAQVFEQAYTRFLDLQNAEAQTREAQISTALERIRNRTLLMRDSAELSEAAVTLFEEFKGIGLLAASDQTYFCTIDDRTKSAQVWITQKDGKAGLSSFTMPLDTFAPLMNVYEGWKQQEPLVFRDLVGDELTDYLHLLASLQTLKTDKEYQQVFVAPPDRRVVVDATYTYGTVGIVSDKPFSQETIDTLVRFAKVFDFTYTRFLDLQNKETQAVNLVIEKQRLENTLTDLRATQAQLIQKEKMASLGELTAGIAHEIQNPLNFVNNFSEVSTELLVELKEELDRGDPDEAKAIANDLSQNLQKITQHGQRASSIVKGMLEHSRTSTGERQPTDINALADEYLRLAYQGQRAKDKTLNATLKTDFATDLTKVEVVPQEIGRVLLNLFNNAFYAVHQKQKSAPADYKPTVTISTRQTDKKVEIEVEDNGAGMPEAVKAKIFQPFFTTKPTGEGTGLGLSLSYDIVIKGHSGTLTVESIEGEGTKFLISMPA